MSKGASLPEQKISDAVDSPYRQNEMKKMTRNDTIHENLEEADVGNSG